MGALRERRAGAPEVGTERGARISLARALSKGGFCSRKEAARLVAEGRVQVGGRRVRLPSLRIDPHDLVSLDGQRLLEPSERIVIALHKPKGYITSRADPRGRATVYALLEGLGHWVFPVGRLDRESAGLLLLTNDHRLGNRLMDPAQHVVKRYHVLVKGQPGPEAVAVLRAGVDIGDPRPTAPARVELLGVDRERRSWLEVSLTEGRNRQLRRMCASVGHDVVELVRVAIGELGLGELPAGQWRRLGRDELAGLRVRVG